MDSIHPLRAWRRENEKTLEQVAGEVSVTPSHLSEIETGNNAMSLALAKRLSRYTGISIDSLVNYEVAQ